MTALTYGGLRKLGATVLQTATLLDQKPRNAAELVELWHADSHAGPFRFCTEQPCYALAHAAETFAAQHDASCNCDCHDY